jgi:serine/threonine protein phosphatase PrpC
MLRVRACGLSDVGLTRVHNEDYFEIDPRHRLYVVADGMGGHSAGEVAAQIAVRAIHDFIEKSVDRETSWSLRPTLSHPIKVPPGLAPAPASAPAPPSAASATKAPSAPTTSASGAAAAPAYSPAVAAPASHAGQAAPPAQAVQAARKAQPAAAWAAGTAAGALPGEQSAAAAAAAASPSPGLPSPPPPPPDDRLARHSRLLKMAVRKAHDNVLTAISKDGSLHGMGTTVVGLLLAGPTAAVAHVGDSRAYRLRNGHLDQLTQDHTWVHEQVVAGLLSQEQARSHPLKNVVTRALGGESEIVVDVREVQVQPGDLYLLCSDGLTGMLSDGEIRERLGSGHSLHEICRSLVNEANARGGLDNVTVVLLAVEDGDEGDDDVDPGAGF